MGMQMGPVSPHHLHLQVVHRTVLLSQGVRTLLLITLALWLTRNNHT
jgi:hypothetical protein